MFKTGAGISHYDLARRFHEATTSIPHTLCRMSRSAFANSLIEINSAVSTHTEETIQL